MFHQDSDSFNLEVEWKSSSLQDNESTALQIRNTIRYFDSHGANIHVSSRLHQYAKLFASDDDASVVSLDQALLEVLQFTAIARSFQLSGNIAQWIPLLRQAAAGHADSEADRPDSRARSLQFELFAMACLTAAGFRVECAEPDLRARIGLVDVAFAAKRLRSESKFEQNLRDAQRQIACQGIPGFIVVDLSFVNRVGKPLYVPRLEQQQVLAKILIDGFAHEHEHTLLRVASKRGVLGVLLFASAAGRSFEPVSRFVSRRWLLIAADDSPTARHLIAAIQEMGERSWGPTKFDFGSSG